ncbi:hypothetical protein GWK47_047760 [Chionoecetes opilio]|uniref:Uncharacterized protein n=1 Tax=Chionoecetes opilio TaxID=41210 RepID=A0A8J4Y5X4_CHIOP|nr:hypothetical protein GWK47_047760 [Chionoecetes opilio]
MSLATMIDGSNPAYDRDHLDEDDELPLVDEEAFCDEDHQQLREREEEAEEDGEELDREEEQLLRTREALLPPDDEAHCVLPGGLEDVPARTAPDAAATLRQACHPLPDHG